VVKGDGDRPRRSWREIDRMRDGSRHSSEERRPSSPKEEQRARAAAQQYVKKLDKLFSGQKGDAEMEQLANRVRDAHGTPDVVDACRAYRDALGLPSDPALLSIFLDTGDPELVCETLEGIAAAAESGEVEVSSGMRTQLRMLAEDPNDDVADAAEVLLERISG
jgi:hypothetical protein